MGSLMASRRRVSCWVTSIAAKVSVYNGLPTASEVVIGTKKFHVSGRKFTDELKEFDDQNLLPKYNDDQRIAFEGKEGISIAREKRTCQQYFYFLKWMFKECNLYESQKMCVGCQTASGLIDPAHPKPRLQSSSGTLWPASRTQSMLAEEEDHSTKSHSRACKFVRDVTAHPIKVAVFLNVLLVSRSYYEEAKSSNVKMEKTENGFGETQSTVESVFTKGPIFEEKRSSIPCPFKLWNLEVKLKVAEVLLLFRQEVSSIQIRSLLSLLSELLKTITEQFLNGFRYDASGDSTFFGRRLNPVMMTSGRIKKNGKSIR
ncbi:hypothetical protein Tco_1122478 [Tanacetum coccineum]|uniref:Uncharacterized protein n=1 Tax=Tanacetum coccineum TaxID=301880 RepID=A0ABQ5J3L9_9ASTR